MPSIIARQDALVFVDKSESFKWQRRGGALFWSPGILIGEKERDALLQVHEGGK